MLFFSKKKMKISGLIVTLCASAVYAQSPFFDQEQHLLNAKYQKSGKMEQKGRTGVAAMHAVLLK